MNGKLGEFAFEKFPYLVAANILASDDLTANLNELYIFQNWADDFFSDNREDRTAIDNVLIMAYERLADLSQGKN